MSSKLSKISRREFLRFAGLAGLGAGLTACAPQVVTQIVKETQIVQQTSIVKETQIVNQTQIVEKQVQVTPTPVAFKKGGKLTIGMNGDTKTLDPHVSQLAVWQNERRQIFDQLLRIGEKGVILPHLAKEYKWVDNKTMELTLEEGVLFHNGEKFTADDVKWTFDRILKPGLPTEFAPRMANIDKYEAVAANKVRISLKAPDSTLPVLLASIDIISKSIPEDKIATTPVGTGAFKFVEWLPNERIVVARNDKYWKANEPYLDQIIYKPLPDAEARIAALLAGDIDVNFASAVKDMPRLATSQGISTEQLPGGGTWMVYLNMRQKPFNDLKVRQALLIGTNRQQYNRDFLLGLSRVTNTGIDPSCWGYNPAVDKMYAYDKEKAKSLLKDAGYTDANPLAVEIIYPVGLEDYKTYSEFFQSQMKDIGVKVTVTGMELAKWSNKIIKEKTYDLAFDGRGLEINEPANVFNDTTFTKPDKENFDGFVAESIPGYMDLITQGLAETDQAKRKEIYFKLQQLWADNLPGWWITANPSFLVSRSWVKGYTAYGSSPYRLNKAWLDK
jgi:peptide/nickel transport system substrate-binding protein